MKIAVYDDRLIIPETMEQFMIKYDTSIFVDIYKSSFALLKNISDFPFKYDALFLDIDKQVDDGFELIMALKKTATTTPIVILTNHLESVAEAIKFNVFDYLNKPIEKEELEIIIKKIKTYKENDKRFFLFSINKKVLSVPYSDILFLEKYKRQVILRTIYAKYVFYMTTESLLKKLPSNFVQIHTSYIVNIHYITTIKKDVVFIRVGNEVYDLPISRKFKDCPKKIVKKLSVLRK